MKIREIIYADFTHWLFNLFIPSANVDGIIASITKQIIALETAVELNCDRADTHQALASDLKLQVLAHEKRADEALDQANRAARVAEKLKALTV